MGFLDRLQGKKKVDPMAEVSATAVAHLREQNLKFQKFMYERVQELEEKVALEQQRLSEAGPVPDGFDDFDGNEFANYGPDSDEPAAGDMRISLEESVSLVDVVEQNDWQPEPLPVEAEPEPVETPPEPEEAPVVDSPPSWEALFGLSGAEAAVQETTPDEALQEEMADEPVEAESELSDTAYESEEMAIVPPKASPTSLASDDTVTGLPVAGEVVHPAAQDMETGGSLLWDWRSSLSIERTKDDTGQTTVSTLDPVWEPEADDIDDVNEEDLDKAETVLGGSAQEEEAPKDDFVLLEDVDEQEQVLDMPLPDDTLLDNALSDNALSDNVGEWS
jgi:hypothetical protein